MAEHEGSVSRERIIAEATRLFVAFGYHRISMREIAEATGISKAGLYYHFRDKEELILEILHSNLVEIFSIIERCRAQGTTCREKITLTMQAIFIKAPEQRAIIRLASQEMPNLSPEAQRGFGAQYHQSFIGQIQSVLEEGMASGELRQTDPELATWVLLGMVYPFFFPSQARPENVSPAAIDTMLNIYFDGMIS